MSTKGIFLALRIMAAVVIFVGIIATIISGQIVWVEYGIVAVLLIIFMALILWLFGNAAGGQ